MTTGKWAQSGVPHSGWACVDIEDAGAPDFVCEMCEAVHIRLIHTMSHPDCPDALRCGCVCAGRMEEDPVRARKREFDFRSTLARRARWLSRKWRRSRSGNPYLNANGFNVVVFPMRGGFGARVEHRWTAWQRLSQRVYPTESHAKLAAFDVLIAKESAR
jgi:hypothetical protein